MKPMLWIALLIVGVLMLAGCQPATVAAEVEAEEVGAPVEVVGLAGTSWVLSSLSGDLPLPGTTVTLDFGGDGAVSGTDGCNRFMTTYVQSGDDLTIVQPAASTMMACEAAVMNQAAAYMDALANVTTFTAIGNQLILIGGNEALATFVVVSQDLSDTMWEVTAYNNGREAVVGLLDGTQITAQFGVDSLVSGNAGCNDYFAGFSVSGDAISIETPATTFRFCDSPAGVMEQEAEYLAALESAATDDQLAVLMTRKVVVDLPKPDPSVPWGRVTAPAGINVRSGPGVNFPVVGIAAYNDEGEIVGRSVDGRWWAAAAPSLPGGIGWVSADFVIATNAEDVPVIDVAPPPVVAPTAIPPATPTAMPAATATPTAQISFGADRTTIDQGQCTILRWNVQNVQAIWIYPQGQPHYRFPRALQGSEQVCPPVTTNYEMRVLRRDGGVETRQITITVNPTAELQISFWADSTSIQQGQCTRLHWDVQNVQGVWVYPQGADFNRYPRVGRDSERVCPNATTTYEMRVLLRDGSTVFRQVTINVTAPPPPPAPDNPLAGSRWQVVQFNDGSGITTLIEGSRITVEFGGNGQVTGNSGCNTFSGSYQVNGNRLSVSQLGGGMMNCPEPEGVMEQEAEFLTTLQSAATFSIDGNRLEIQNGAGQLAAIANRAQ
jgi:heat shock protein HslJ/uncharacterized protein YraI